VIQDACDRPDLVLQQPCRRDRHDARRDQPLTAAGRSERPVHRRRGDSRGAPGGEPLTQGRVSHEQMTNRKDDTGDDQEVRGIARGDAIRASTDSKATADADEERQADESQKQPVADAGDARADHQRQTGYRRTARHAVRQAYTPVEKPTHVASTGEPRARPDRPRSDQEIEAVVAAYASLISRAVRRLAGSQAPLIQDDVQQVVMVGLWRQLERGQTIERPASYIFRAAVRETVRLLRRHRAHPPGSGRVPDVETVEAGAAADPHRALEEKERQRAILDAMRGLAVARQQAVRAHLSGFDVREIMGMFGWSYQRARHLIARGMADLRRALRERGIDE